MLTISRTATLYILAILVAIVNVIGVYIYIRHQGVLAERQRQQELMLDEANKTIAKYNAEAKALEAQLAEMRDANDKLAKELEDETHKNPVYTTCRVPADGVRLLQQAVGRAGTR